jgi:hypothetical protein
MRRAASMTSEPVDRRTLAAGASPLKAPAGAGPSVNSKSASSQVKMS